MEPTLIWTHWAWEHQEQQIKLWLSRATVALAQQQPGCLGEFSLRYQRGKSWKSSEGRRGVHFAAVCGGALKGPWECREVALPWGPRGKSKDKRKGRIIWGKQTDLKQNHPGAVPGGYEPRESLSQGWSRGRCSHGRMSQHVDLSRSLAGWGWGFQQGGECERPHSWNGKPHTVTAFGSSPGAGREPWLGCWWEGGKLVVHSNWRPVGRLYGVWGERWRVLTGIRLDGRLCVPENIGEKAAAGEET